MSSICVPWEDYQKQLSIHNEIKNFDMMEYIHGDLPIKHQLNCLMCWSIAACDCVALGLTYLTGKPLVELSCSQILDCLRNPEMNSREGYRLHYRLAFDYMVSHGALKADDYPFRPHKYPCRRLRRQQDLKTVKIASYNKILNDEFTIMGALRSGGSICGAVDWNKTFQDLQGDEVYQGDKVYQSVAEKKKNPHAIVITGFDYDEVKDIRYWKVRNSFGASWGIDGYGRIARPSSSLDQKEPLITRLYQPVYFK